MSISIDKKKKILTLSTAHTSYQMMADELGYLLHLYYGKKLDSSPCLDYLLTYLDRGFSGNPRERAKEKTYSLDVLPQEFSFRGTGDYRNVCLLAENEDGSTACDLRYKDCKIAEGKYELKGLPAAKGSRKEKSQTLSVLLEDRYSKLQVELLYGVYEEKDIITRAAVIRNAGKKSLTIKRAATVCMDFLGGSYDLIHFHGRHVLERQFERTAIEHASVNIGSKRGSSSHQHNPAVILAEKDACETSGSVFGFALSYSGGFLCEAEKDQFGQTRLVMGMTDDLLSYPLKSGEELTLPECIMTYTDGGFRKLTHLYHDFAREYIIRSPKGFTPSKRPVLINSWEAAYFDFSGETILRLAKNAAPLGIDMVVMDDGWFGKRNNDFSGLGDWKVNEKKLGMSLGKLICEIEKLGLRFGIWIEPEMISEDSDLYRNHPDWALQIPGRSPVFARNQLVLDFSREDVRSYIFDSICGCLDQGHVSYVKWDMNRSLYDIYSAENLPGTVQYKYVLGVYDFLEKLTKRYPQLIIEGCSGGGGRFDFGMLSYVPQIWCSDNSDAADRSLIQYGTSFFYPASTMGAHVSAVPNHQTGRTTPLITRGITAMAGTFGYELDPAKLNEEELEIIKKMSSVCRYQQELICSGDYFRLSDPHKDGIAAWAFVDKKKTKSIVSIVRLENHGGMEVKYIKPAGLQEDAFYKAEVILSSLDCPLSGSFSGAALMNAGIPLVPQPGEYGSVMIQLRKIKK